jgi:hypothetical protein
MTALPGTVFLVDDDPAVVKGLERLLRAADRPRTLGGGLRTTGLSGGSPLMH